MNQTIDAVLAYVARQLRAPGAHINVLRLDTPEQHLDKALYESDRDNLRARRGAFIRRARATEWDWTSDGLGSQILNRPPFPLAGDEPGELLRKIHDHVPPLWVLVMQDHEHPQGVYVQMLWRGPALAPTCISHCEEVFNVDEEGVKRIAAYCRANDFFDAHACDEFSSYVALVVAYEYGDCEGVVN